MFNALLPVRRYARNQIAQIAKNSCVLTIALSENSLTSALSLLHARQGMQVPDSLFGA